MLKPQGYIKAWATDFEQAEADEAMAHATTIEPRNLPSLKEVMISKPKKNMGTNIMLSEFNHCSFD